VIIRTGPYAYAYGMTSHHTANTIYIT